MNELYNVYCDESCHLENDGINDMVLGAVWCPQKNLKEITEQVKRIKQRHGVRPKSELKWTKVAPVKNDLYIECLDYFFDCPDLHFRALLIPDKKRLDHKRFSQTHDDWYYKMYFDMLKAIFDPPCRYEVYMDIKDTNSYIKAKRLQEVCRNNIRDFSGNVIKRIQPIRSNEVQIMQIVDILIGAVAYQNRIFNKDYKKSETKLRLIELIKRRSCCGLEESTSSKEKKFNLFVWEAR